MQLPGGLGADPREFSEGADAGLVQGLTEAAAGSVTGGEELADLKVEVDRVGELIGRFPGWAGLWHICTTAQRLRVKAFRCFRTA